MRVLSRVALVIVLSLVSFPLAATHLQSECPLTLVGSNAGSTAFALSPHGVFRNGTLVYVLRGQTLSTYSTSDVGELQVVREDFIGTLGARDPRGGVAYANGHLYVSGEPGLEIYDLRNVRAGGTAPVLVSRTPGLHYRRIAVNGSLLAGLYPSTDLPCAPSGTIFCNNAIDIVAVSNLSAPVRISSINTINTFGSLGFNDIAFNRGFLFVAAEGGLFVYNLLNPMTPIGFLADSRLPGKFLVSNGVGIVGIGNHEQIHLYTVGPTGVVSRFSILVIPHALTIDRINPIAFHPQAWVDEQNGRVVTMINEINPQTLQPARTIAFDVFDYSIPMWEGSFERGYEDITYFTDDEVKHNPLGVGSSVFTVGEISGLQVWGGCGAPSGRVEWDGTHGMNCGGTELRGWVTGPQRVANVEVFLDGSSLGSATIEGPPRADIGSKFPVYTWRITVNLDSTPRGEHVIRAVATDALGARRQFAEQRVFFPGPGQNCTTRRRSAR
ncbi:MAG TPA: hypothetical protein VNA04_07740 [Thermoanaerobaculia bacterium]|nr:hypothetical protein [Thermoanaerobaculia bacterium]